MKFLHLSDFHLGKLVHGQSMLEEQEAVLEQILELVQEHQPDAVLLCGDLYDRPVPPEGAVRLMDGFLTALSERNVPVLAVSGNHDSAERVAFASRVLRKERLYFSPAYRGKVEQIPLEDEFGTVHFYLMPFLRPANIRPYFPDREITDYNSAFQAVIESMELAEGERNVLLAHQFLLGGSTCESEELSVGGVEQLDAGLFEPFDYTALGHLHSPQKVSGKIRYCGTPLKYSFSEAGQQKGALLVELQEKGNLTVTFLPLTPRHDLREIRGSYEQLTSKAFYDPLPRGDYYHITLTDEDDVFLARERLREIYPNLLKLDYDNLRTRQEQEIDGGSGQIESRNPVDLFDSLYELMNNRPMGDEERRSLSGLAEEIWGKL